MVQRHLSVIALVLSATLAGCGGGGGSSGSAAAPSTPPPPPSGLLAPTNVSVVETVPGQITVQWQDNATSELAYKVIASEASIPGVSPAFSSPPLSANTSQYTITGLEPGIAYQIVVQAYNGAGVVEATVQTIVDGGVERRVSAYFEVQQGVYYEAGIAGSGNQSFGTAAPAPVGGVVIGTADSSAGTADYFVAEDLPAGSTVALVYLEAQSGEDLDVDLYDDEMNLTAFSAAPAGEDEEVSVVAGGTVVIRVVRTTANVAGDPQKYALSILTPAQQLAYAPLTTGSARSLYSSESELLAYTAVMVDERGAEKTRQLSVGGERVERVYTNKRGGTVERVSFPRPTSQLSADASDSVIQDKRNTVRLVKEYAKLNRGTTVIPAVKMTQASVTFATGTPPTSDPLAAGDWQFAAHNGAEGWLWTRGLNASDSPVKVGVIDGGIYPTADLADALLPGHWVYRDPTDPWGPLVVENYQEVGARGNGTVDNHGTLAAAIIAGERNNGSGNTGYIPDAKILPVRVTAPGESQIDNAAVVAALEWSVDNGAAVINLSIGAAEQGWSGIRTGVWYAISNDVPVIGAAGNSGSRLTPGNSLIAFYGNDDGAWAVSAYARNGNRASYSSYGPYVNIAAAVGEVADQVCAGSILGTTQDPANPVLTDFYEGTDCKIGTSFSAPVVAAAVGMMKAINPNLTNAQLQALLQSGELTNADSAGAFTEDAGYGVIDFGKAASAAAEGQINASMVSVAGDLDFAGFRTQMPLTIDRVGFPGHSIQFSGVPAGVTISAVNVDEAGFGEYLVSYNREIANSSVSATITVTTSEGKMDTFMVAGYTPDLGNEAESYVGAAEVSVVQGGMVLSTGVVEAVGPRTLRYHATKAVSGVTADTTTYEFVLSYDADADGNTGEAGEAAQVIEYTTGAAESLEHTVVGPSGMVSITMM